ncbi:MAG: family 10 glycosylhydrolase [Dysgonamonadaceae bacterium]|jgi:uncharacterized lipoprotein YddW (UPF0748 family)|nr:family 10 glycosylhydrolase [Dysgonamonadaceae bacterium]
MKRTYFLLFFACACACIRAHPKQEIRAVWLTVNYGLDWPEKPFQNVQDIVRQQYELDQILDKLGKSHINTIFIQTRMGGNVIYPSKIESRSEYIRSPYATADYDPLAYMVNACHKRGMECHAWFVVYPFGREKSKHSGIMKNNKNGVKTLKKELYLDPGYPGTTSYLTGIIREIVSSYDIDGIHFDYIRYPNNANFPDQDTYSRYGSGKNKADWRRENINRFVYTAYDAIKSLKPWVQVSSSVVGMYKNIPENARKHWTAYHSVFQDPIDWLSKGKHDFIVPMMYYSDNLFFPFVQDWMAKSTGRYIVPGLGLFQMNEKEAAWDEETLLEQMQYSRNKHTAGNAFFRAQSLMENQKGILDKMNTRFYTCPALLPALTWLSNKVPSSPSLIRAEKSNKYLQLKWDKVFQKENQAIYYNIYRAETIPVDIENSENLVAMRIMENHYEISIDHSKETGYYYVVTSYDRYHNESRASAPAYFVTGNFEK